MENLLTQPFFSSEYSLYPPNVPALIKTIIPFAIRTITVTSESPAPVNLTTHHVTLTKLSNAVLPKENSSNSSATPFL